MIIPRLILLRMTNVSDKFIHSFIHLLCTGNQNTHILFSLTFYRRSRRLWDNMKKYCTTRQATNDNMAHVHCMLDTSGYKHILRSCNAHCFSTTTTIARTHLNVTLTYTACLVNHSLYLQSYVSFHMYFPWHIFHILHTQGSIHKLLWYSTCITTHLEGTPPGFTYFNMYFP